MGISDAGKNALLNAWDETASSQGGAGLGATHISLHTGDPGETGANEVSGGSPAYARKAATWAAASGGSKALSSALTFDVPAGTTVTHVGLHNHLTTTGGTAFLVSVALTNSRAFTNQGTLEVSAATISIPDS